MGRQSIQKQIEREQRDAKFCASLVERSKKYKQPEEKIDFATFLENKEKFQRDPDAFVFRGKSKDKTKQFLHFVRYVYEKYPTPRIFDNVWIDHFAKPVGRMMKESEFINWYICVATGDSLHKKYTNEFLTKKETHIFLNISAQLNVRQALYFSIAVSAGADVSTATMIARSRLSEQNYKLEFWRNCARFFATHRPTSESRLSDVVDYLVHRYGEDRNFTLFGMGHTFESLVKHMEKWHADLGRIKILGNMYWDGHAINDDTFVTDVDQQKLYWHFKQIKTSKELALEGNMMRHCVYSYRDRCRDGHISIWSLSTSSDPKYDKSAKRRVTIELSNDGRITQAKKKANIAPTADERKIIYKWANKNGLSANVVR